MQRIQPFLLVAIIAWLAFTSYQLNGLQKGDARSAPSTPHRSNERTATENYQFHYAGSEINRNEVGIYRFNRNTGLVERFGMRYEAMEGHEIEFINYTNLATAQKSEVVNSDDQALFDHFLKKAGERAAKQRQEALMVPPLTK